MNKKISKIRLLIITLVLLFLVIPTKSFASTPKNKGDYYGPISVSSDQWKKIRPLFNTSKKILFINYSTYNYQDKGNKKLIIQGVNDLLSKNAVYLIKGFPDNVGQETISSITSRKEAWSVIRDLYRDYDKDTANKIDDIITGKSLVVGGGGTSGEAGSICDREAYKDKFLFEIEGDIIICKASTKNFTDLKNTGDTKIGGVIYAQDLDILVLSTDVIGLPISDASRIKNLENLRGYYLKINLYLEQNDKATHALLKDRLLKNIAVIDANINALVASGGSTIKIEITQDGKIVSAAKKGNRLTASIKYQNDLDTKLKIEAFVAKSTAANNEFKSIWKSNISEKSSYDKSFNFDTSGLELGDNILRVKLFDNNDIQIGLNTDTKFTLVASTDEEVLQEKSEQAQITLIYPKSFTKDKEEQVKVSTANPNIKSVQLFVSTVSAVNSTKSIDGKNICPLIAKSDKSETCELCQPIKLTCKNGECGSGGFKLSSLGQHRLVAVGFKNDECSENNILAINNNNIIEVKEPEAPKQTFSDGGIELKIPETFVQNQKTYVQIKTEDKIRSVHLYVSTTDNVELAAKYTKETVCDAAAKSDKSDCDICHPVVVACSAGNCESPFFSIDQIGQHRIVAVGYDNELQKSCDGKSIIGMNTKGVFTVSEEEEKIETDIKTKSGLTVEYPKIFYQLESTPIKVNSTNNDIKYIQLFSSRDKTMDAAAALTPKNVCAAISQSYDKENCQICHPTKKIACTNGVCNGGSLAIQEETNHRLVVVGFNADGDCSESKIAAINNDGIFKVIKRPVKSGGSGSGVEKNQTVTINWVLNIKNYKEAINWIINIAGLLLGAACFVAILIGGFMLLTAGGNDEAVKKGTKAILMAILGLVIGAISYGIITLIISILNKITA